MTTKPLTLLQVFVYIFGQNKKYIRKVTKPLPFFRLGSESISNRLRLENPNHAKKRQWIFEKYILKLGLKWTNFSVRISVNGASLSLHHKLFS